MSRHTAYKIGQLLGAVAMIAGVTACMQRELDVSSRAWLVGGLLYGGCRLAAWFDKP